MSAARVDGHTGQRRVLDASGQAIEDCARFSDRVRLRGLAANTVDAYAYDLAVCMFSPSACRGSCGSRTAS